VGVSLFEGACSHSQVALTLPGLGGLQGHRHDAGICRALENATQPDWATQSQTPIRSIVAAMGSTFVSNLIEFLERIGQDSDLRYAGSEMLEEALREAGIDPALRAAILGKDQRVIEDLIGAQPNICCTVHREDEEEEEPEEEEEGEEEEDDENEKALLASGAR
jgi:hypothetical protein